MKIIMFEPFISVGENIGGDAKQIIKLSKILEKKGHETEFINYNLSGVFSRNIKFIIKFFLASNKKIDGDVIYASGSPFTSVLTSFLGRKLKIPTVVNVTHLNSFSPFFLEGLRIIKTNFNEGGLKFSLSNLTSTLRIPFLTTPEILKQKNISKIGLLHTTKIIASCDYVKKNIKFLTRRKDITTIYPLIDITKTFSPNKKKTALYFGALYSGRGVIDLIYSFSLLSKKLQNINLNICSYPILDQYTFSLSKFLIKKYNLKSAKLSTNYKSNIFREISDASVICLPFKYPPFQPPLTMLEAMVAARPVITTDIGSSREFIENNKTGFLIQVGNIEELSDKISLLLEDKRLARKIGKNARKKVIEKCNWKKSENKIINILETFTKR